MTRYAFLFIALAACAEPTARSSASAAHITSAAATPAPDLTGTWAFDLASSGPAAQLRADCTAGAGGDAAKADACWSEVAAEAKREKIRFTSDRGRTRWTSFGTDGEGELVFVEAPVTLTAEGDHVLATIAGPPSGRDAARFASAKIDALRIEIVDASTIALADTKGRLVYHKE